MRDVLFFPLNELEELVISTDCSGGIGLKDRDVVKVPYDTVGYYGARVAFMELMSVGATPIAMVMQNFIHDEAWRQLLGGVNQVMTELDLAVPVTGSTESNMPLLQSAVGFMLLGKIQKNEKRISITPRSAKLAVVGEPLVGEKVITYQNRVLPLSIFRQLLKAPGIYEIIPIGSKGISYEVEQLLAQNSTKKKTISCALPLNVSSGPATSVLISYCPEFEENIKLIAKDYFFPINFIDNGRKNIT